MTEQNLITPGEVAQMLGVSSSTLRRWSSRFAEYLSSGAGLSSAGSGSHSHRRYSQEDVAVLRTIRDMLSQGYTYEHILHVLSLRSEAKGQRSGELAPVPQEAAAGPPALTLFTNAMHTIAEGQQLLLNSQQVSRELLNVVIQDNFQLKEENARLRERMMRLEQELSENRRRAEARIEMLERRLERLESVENENTVQPVIRTRKGWLARLLGL